MSLSPEVLLYEVNDHQLQSKESKINEAAEAIRHIYENGFISKSSEVTMKIVTKGDIT